MKYSGSTQDTQETTRIDWMSRKMMLNSENYF